MKNFTQLFSVLFVFASILGCKNEAEPQLKTVDVTASNQDVKTLDPNAHYAKAEFGIDGMTCAVGCAKTIEKKLAKMEGVKSAKVDFDKKLAMVEYNEDKVTPSNLEEAVKMAGDAYTVENMQTVDHFSTEKSTVTGDCPPDCDKSCCADKKDCPKDCQMPCCKDK
ncbi:heavy-metal-associated domain-containing protein [Aegicerativicinus sediminis]